LVPDGETISLIAFDPGINPGFCNITRSPFNCTTLKSGFIKCSSDWPGAARLNYVTDEIQKLITENYPQYVAIEDIALVRPPKGKFQKNNYFTPYIYGYIVTLCYRLGIKVVLVTPNQAKKALTGKGGADKDAMVRAANGLGYIVGSKDEADAIGIAIAASERIFK
jgi:Holliday junction resolvasome RuvABC endonuclease subunit